MKRFQFVWWGWKNIEWPWIKFKKLNPHEHSLALIYKWVFFIGPLEIRRWLNPVK